MSEVEEISVDKVCFCGMPYAMFVINLLKYYVLLKIFLSYESEKNNWNYRGNFSDVYGCVLFSHGYGI